MKRLIGDGFATKFDALSLTSSTGSLSLILATTLTFGQKSQSLDIRKLELWVQLLSFEASAALPRVPVSAGLFPYDTTRLQWRLQ